MKLMPWRSLGILLLLLLQPLLQPSDSYATEVSCAQVNVYVTNLYTGQNVSGARAGIRCTNTSFSQCSGTDFQHLDGACWENSGYQNIDASPSTNPAVFGLADFTEGYDCDKGGGALYVDIPTGWTWVCTTDGSKSNCSDGSNVDKDNLGLDNGLSNVVKVFYKPPPPAVPTSLTASCPLPGTSARLSWTVSGATYSQLRVDAAPGPSGTWSNDCAALNAGDICNNNTSSPYTFTSTAGARYRWWVHACNDSPPNGSNCSAAADNTFTCTAPAGGPTLSVSCSVSPTSTTTGTNVTWTAYPAGGTSPYTYSWSGTNSLSGTSSSVTKSYSSAGTKTGSVSISDSAGTAVSANCTNSVTVTAPPNPTVDIKANGSNGPITIANSETASLTWTTTNTSSCTAQSEPYDSLWTGTKATNNTTGQRTSALLGPNTYTYILTCQNATGTSRNDSVVVNISAPAICKTFSVTPTGLDLTVSSTQTLFASGLDGTVTYSSANNAIATVNSSGVVTGVSAGTTTVTGTDSGNASLSCASETRSVTINVSTTPVPGTTTPTSAPVPSAAPGELTYAIEGVVFIDTNRNGRKDTGEQCYNGLVRVSLGATSINHNQDQSCTNRYRFTGIPAGTYSVSMDPLADWESTLTPPWTAIFLVP